MPRTSDSIAGASLAAATYLFALLTLLANDFLLKRDVSLSGQIYKVDGGVRIELDTIDILRQQTPIDVEPSAEAAMLRIRKCLAAETP